MSGFFSVLYIMFVKILDLKKIKDITVEYTYKKSGKSSSYHLNDAKSNFKISTDGSVISASLVNDIPGIKEKAEIKIISKNTQIFVNSNIFLSDPNKYSVDIFKDGDEFILLYQNHTEQAKVYLFP